MKTRAKQNCLGGRSAAAFTLVELLMVISIIGIVAALTVATIGAAAGKRDENAVKAKLAKLVLAIEDYKVKTGHYPPDEPVFAAANPHWNPLAYELSGVRRTNANFFPEADPNHTITPVMLSSYFNLTGLANAGKDASTLPKYSLNLTPGSGKNADYVLLTNSAAGLPPPVMLLQVPAEHPAGGAANVWRYRAYPSGGHNPNSFDLWAEYKKRGGGTNILGNWRK